MFLFTAKTSLRVSLVDRGKGHIDWQAIQKYSTTCTAQHFFVETVTTGLCVRLVDRQAFYLVVQALLGMQCWAFK